MTHRASALKDALADAGALYLPDRLHAVRIAVKKLRYAREVLVEASGARTKGELRSLKRGQDILGRLHDMQMLLDRVRQLQASLTPPDVTMWRKLDTLTTALENDCRRLHARFMRQRDVVLTVCDRTAGPKVSRRGRRAARPVDRPSHMPGPYELYLIRHGIAEAARRSVAGRREAAADRGGHDRA